jgi:hypothetical protein
MPDASVPGACASKTRAMDGQIHGRFSQKKIELVPDAAQRVIGQLQEGDYLTVVAFSDRVQVLTTHTSTCWSWIAPRPYGRACVGQSNRRR